MTDEKLVEKVAREMVTIYNEEDGDQYTDEDWDLFIPNAKLAIRVIADWIEKVNDGDVDFILWKLKQELK
jgi:hypothetical protein